MNHGPVLDELSEYSKKNLGWYCDVCGRYRKDKLISVYTVDLSRRFNCVDGTVNKNYKYCNDSRYCSTHIKIMAESDIYKISNPI